jgi:formamidopyrimidine-DNA glycosylase
VAELGLDALDPALTVSVFTKLLRAQNRQMKALLLDQTVIAGLGNIYVDEALYLAQIHPLSLSAVVPEENLKELFKAMRKVLNQSLAYQGTTFRDYRTARGDAGGFFSKLHVYGRQNQPCHRCGTAIQKLKVVQRGTHVCGRCQEKFV